MFVVKGKKQEICEKLVKKIELVIHIDNNDLNIEADFKSKMGYNSSTSISLKVPHRLKIECESMNGGIFVENITGEVELETTNGGIKCENVSGGVVVETVNSGVSLTNIEGNTIAKTVNGGLFAEFSKTTPDQVSLETVNGRVSVMLCIGIDIVKFIIHILATVINLDLIDVWLSVMPITGVVADQYIVISIAILVANPAKVPGKMLDILPRSREFTDDLRQVISQKTARYCEHRQDDVKNKRFHSIFLTGCFGIVIWILHLPEV